MKKFKFVIMFLMAVFGSGQVSDAATEIDACGTIDSPGEYVLNTSISSASTCITITSSNVTFDGAGYTIDGDDAGGDYGVYVYNASQLSNVTVKNLVVTDWFYGIYYEKTSNGSISNNTANSNMNGIHFWTSSNYNTLTNNTASSNTWDGIYIYSSSNNILSANNFSNNNGNGIYLDTSNDNNITDSNASENNVGIYIYKSNRNNLTNNTEYSDGTGITLDESSNNTLTCNTISNNDNGIYIRYSSNNTISNNNASSNTGGYGVYLTSSTTTKNTISNNNFSSNNIGIVLDSSSNNNTLTNNTANSNTQYGIYVSSSSNNTIYNNSFNNTNNFGFSGTTNNFWNTTKTTGTSIAGGPFLGGNFWAHPNGTGFSKTCTDADGDSICDSSYTLDSNNIDYLPLKIPASTGATPISACGQISSAGEYVLNTSISSVSTCVNITSSDVIFDGAGYTIDGTDAAGTYGVYVYNSSTPLTNVTVKNATITNWDYGIYYQNAQNGSITGNTASSNSRGIYLSSSSNNTLRNNNASSNSRGIYLSSSSNNTITNNTVTSNGDGIDFFSSSNNNTITNNTATLNTNGIYLSSSSNNTITNNTATSNGDGIDFSTSSYNIITNNNASFNTNDGFYFYRSSYNTITNNNASNTNDIGIYFRSSCNNAITSNIASSNPSSGMQFDVSSNNNTLTGNTVNSNYGGFQIIGSSNNTFTNNYANLNTWAGIYLTSSSNNNILTGNTANSNNEDGIQLASSSNNNTIRNNTANSNSYGIRLTGSSNNNTIYNNSFNNTNNSVVSGTNNFWNTTKTAGTNIAGGSYLGGNFWAHPNGTGFSKECTDADDDGICDLSYTLDANNIDYLPLSSNVSPDSTPPASITSLTNISYASNYINWTWTDPSDSDLVNVSIYLNGTFMSNVSSGVQYYNATGLSPDTAYNISTRTVDQTGNINQTWNNNTARTAPASSSPTPTPAPASQSSGGSSGSGSSSVASSEPSSNIETVTVLSKDIRANTEVTYSFPQDKGVISEIGINGKENVNEVVVRVEQLKGLSKQLNEPAPGDVYYYVIINVGTKKINDATIKFKVENKWLEDMKLDDSDVKLVKWDGTKWKKLENKTESGYYFSLNVVPNSPEVLTTEGNYKLNLDVYASGTGGEHIENGYGFNLVPTQKPQSYSFDATVTGKNEMYTFYEATTESFSTFAITGMKSLSADTAMNGGFSGVRAEVMAAPEAAQKTPEKTPPVRPDILFIVFVLMSIIVTRYIKKNNR